MTASTSYDYYLIANNGNITAANLTALQAITQTDITNYNGVWNTVNDTVTIPKRSESFVMTGNQPNASLNTTGTTSISIPLKRIVAKLALEVNISALITLGISTVTTVTINQSARSPIYFPSPLSIRPERQFNLVKQHK